MAAIDLIPRMTFMRWDHEFVIIKLSSLCIYNILWRVLLVLYCTWFEISHPSLSILWFWKDMFITSWQIKHSLCLFLSVFFYFLFYCDQFLEEAKQYALESDFQTSSTSYPEESGERRSGQEKKKKSWKKLLFPWLKGEKLNKTSTKPATKSQVSDARRTNVSGPVFGTVKVMDDRLRRPLSGPINSLFRPTKRTDSEVPYKCLDKTGSTQVVQTYGPVYLVR